MRDFPQELVDQVIDELFSLVGRKNCYLGHSSRFTTQSDHGISSYSLVSRAWASSTQKHHFKTLSLDSPAILEKWRTRIAPNPTGVSRHVRELVLDGFDPPDLECFERHLHALTRVENLTVKDCYDVLGSPSFMEWYPLMGPSLVELRIDDSPATPHTIASLLAALPLLQSLEIRDFEIPEDTDEPNTPIPSQIPFFEGVSHLAFFSGRDNNTYPEGSLDWIPFSARFGQLKIDIACAIHRPDLVNQWLTSSRETLTHLTIWGDSTVPTPSNPTPLDLSPCTVLKSLRIPISFAVEALPLRVASSQIESVVLTLHGRSDQDSVGIGNLVWEVMEKRLCPLAKKFSDAHPGKKMEVDIVGVIRGRSEVEVLKILRDKRFLPKLKEEAEVLVPARSPDWPWGHSLASRFP